MATGEPRIRKCTEADADLIAELGARTFFETYSADTPATQMRRHLSTAFAPDAVRKELSNPESTFYVAEVSGEAVGFVKLNVGSAQTDLPNEGGLEIESLYVSRSIQGRGLGRLLFERALADAEAAEASYLWLGVWERNAAAYRFWRRLGFVEYGSHPFDFGGAEHTDLLMRRELRGPATPG